MGCGARGCLVDLSECLEHDITTERILSYVGSSLDGRQLSHTRNDGDGSLLVDSEFVGTIVWRGWLL